MVLLDLEQGEYFGLDALGAQLVGAFSDDDQLEQLCDRLSAGYEVTAKQLRADAERLVAELAARGMLAAPIVPTAPA